MPPQVWYNSELGCPMPLRIIRFFVLIKAKRELFSLVMVHIFEYSRKELIDRKRSRCQ